MKKMICNTIFISSVLLIVIFTGGFVTSLKLVNRNQTAQSKIPNNSLAVKEATASVSSTCTLLLLGDSLAEGTGDEKGQGFTGFCISRWKEELHKDFQVSKIVGNGYTTTNLLKILQKEQAKPKIQSAKVILLSIGGNEVSQYKKETLPQQSLHVQATIQTYENNLKQILSLIRSNNKSCTIAFVGLYNPFGKTLSSEKLKLLNTWNYKTEQLLAEDSRAVFIPTLDLFQYNLHKYLAVDLFHPNNDGYTAISQRIYESLKLNAL